MIMVVELWHLVVVLVCSIVVVVAVVAEFNKNIKALHLTVNTLRDRLDAYDNKVWDLHNRVNTLGREFGYEYRERTDYAQWVKKENANG